MEEKLRVYIPGRPRIVAIGGGHGLSTMLRGLKHYTRDISAVVTTADDGGGSGILRQELGMLPPGDARDCILALSNTEPVMQQLMAYRFEEGSLKGQNFGNLLLAALYGCCGSFSEAIRQMGQVLSITGRVLPVTEEDVHIRALFDNGREITGESEIYYYKKRTGARICQIEMLPEHPPVYPTVLKAIERADLILIGPGSLYTSIIPNFLVDGVADAVRRAKGLKIMVMNLMTQDGETERYTAADHLRAFFRHAGPGTVDICIANNAPVPPHLREEYRREDAEELFLDREAVEAQGVLLREAPLLSARSDFARHDPELLAEAILQLWENRNSR